jgi:hypothetical protein
MNVDLPDWRDDTSITFQPDASYLNDLDDLRVTEPIFHAMVMGTRTVANMARRIGWPYNHIIWQLREYKKDARVVDDEGRRAVLWYLTTDPLNDELWGLKAWVDAQRKPGGLFVLNEE